MQVDLLVHSAAQLVTCANPDGPKRGAAMQDVGIIEDGAAAISGEKIVAVGASSDIRARFDALVVLDASGKVVCPGFVDPHTHAIYAGQRINEFEMRIRGATYLDIMRAGGGILSTMRAVRGASLEQLVDETCWRLDRMVSLGTTTAEMKSGYGLNTAQELKLLEAAAHLQETHVIDLVPTFMGAHAVPPEFSERPNQYVELLLDETLPAAWDWYRNSVFRRQRIPIFNDVFCEIGAFDVEQSRRILEAGSEQGFQIKAHVDEFTSLGGLRVAVDLGATSVDHLDVTPHEDVEYLAGSTTIGVVIPTVNFNLGSTHFANARAMVDAGAAVALTTDLNPGSSPCPSMPQAMAIACRYQHLLPSEALNASTINAAHAVGLGDRVGSIEVGKQADLLLIDAPDYRHLAYQFGDNLVLQVIKRGIPLWTTGHTYG